MALFIFMPLSISFAEEVPTEVPNMVSNEISKDVPDHDENYFIDELNVLSDESKEIINSQDLPHGSQIFVLTVDNMDYDPFDYGMKAFEKYKLGDEMRNNGILILLARTSEGLHHIRIIAGYGIEDILPDGKVGRIIDNYMMDDFRDGNLDQGLIKGFNEFSDVLINQDVIRDEKEKCIAREEEFMTSPPKGVKRVTTEDVI